jgi:hypothetical protein
MTEARCKGNGVMHAKQMKVERPGSDEAAGARSDDANADDSIVPQTLPEYPDWMKEARNA